MPIFVGTIILNLVGATEIAGFAVTASTAAIVGNIALVEGATELKTLPDDPIAGRPASNPEGRR